ncbi:STN domain-containing protein [Natranaerofaba carboxydovora]|uniref:STN domain-containing protein n=1 Tax=Natranaerofaba carboxydovora TaxID=2742683 RepID=UPI001F131D42|nr:STN domain-containing protein [Natranaerofaba carboxydovora]UMZ73511.1 IV_pilus_PilQ: type IV pilus secretin PilQ [Natranaerofaba carboxydovora]
MKTAKLAIHTRFLILPVFIMSIILMFVFSNVNGNIDSVSASSSLESFEMANGTASGEEWDPDSELVDPGNITVDVRDSDIRDALSIIAIKMDVNIIFTEEPVDVTFQVDNVPPREALELLVQKEGLNYIEDGNIIVVGSGERLQEDFFSRMELTRFDLSYITSEQLDGIIQDMGIDVETIVIEDNPESIWVQGTSFSLVKIKELVNSIDREENRGSIDDLDSEETTTFTFSFQNIVAEDAVERLEAYGFDDVQTVTSNLSEFSNELIVIVPPHKEDEVYESLSSIDEAGGRARAPITTARGENAWEELAAKRRLLSDMTDLSVDDMFISENISGDEEEPHHVLWTDKPADKINYLQNLVESFE